MSLKYLFLFNFRYEWSWKRETIWLARVSHCIILVNKPWKVIPTLLFFVTSVQQIHHKSSSVSMPGLFAETFLCWRIIRMTDIKQHGRVVCLFVCLSVCLFGFGFRPTRKIFTHVETSPLPVKNCTQYHEAARVILSATPTVTQNIREFFVYYGHPQLRTRDTHT